MSRRHQVSLGRVQLTENGRDTQRKLLLLLLSKIHEDIPPREGQSGHSHTTPGHPVPSIFLRPNQFTPLHVYSLYISFIGIVWITPLQDRPTNNN